MGINSCQTFAGIGTSTIKPLGFPMVILIFLFYVSGCGSTGLSVQIFSESTTSSCLLSFSRSNSMTNSVCGVCGNKSTAIAFFATNGSPRSCFEQGRIKSTQFLIALWGEHDTYTSLSSPRAFLNCVIERMSERREVKNQTEPFYQLF